MEKWFDHNLEQFCVKIRNLRVMRGSCEVKGVMKIVEFKVGFGEKALRNSRCKMRSCVVSDDQKMVETYACIEVKH